MGIIVYNVTSNVDSPIYENWLNWMKNEHIPDVLASGYFSSFKIFKLHTSQQDENGVTVAVQYFTDDMGKLEKYLTNYAPNLRDKHYQKYGDRVLTFRTVLEEI